MQQVRKYYLMKVGNLNAFARLFLKCLECLQLQGWLLCFVNRWLCLLTQMSWPIFLQSNNTEVSSGKMSCTSEPQIWQKSHFDSLCVCIDLCLDTIHVDRLCELYGNIHGNGHTCASCGCQTSLFPHGLESSEAKFTLHQWAYKQTCHHIGPLSLAFNMYFCARFFPDRWLKSY